MKFAVCNEIFESNDLSQAYEFTRNLGYTGIEVAPFTLGDRPTKLSLAERNDFSKKAGDAGLEIVGLHWLLVKTEGFHLTTDDATVRKKTADYFRELIELCSDLGGSIMVLGSPKQRNFNAPMSHDDAMRNAAELISSVSDELVAHDVVLAVEPLGPGEGNFLNLASQGVELIHQIDCPNVKLHLDVKAMSTEPSNVGDIIRNRRKELIHFHANDPNLLGPGMGEFDQIPVFQALRDINYDRWVSVEVFDFGLGYQEILRQSWQAMRSAIDATR